MVRSRHPRYARKRWTSAAARRLMKIAGYPETIETAVKFVVARLLEGIDGPPTDVGLVAQRLNIVNIVKEDIPYAGELRETKSGFEVVCMNGSSRARDRFTTAHEIAHAVFEMSGPNPPRTGTELERICDMMATEMLMPEAIFRLKFLQDPTISGWFRLAALFKTSLAATGIRCYEIAKTPVFEVHENRLTWSCGLDNDMRSAIVEALHYTHCGNKELKDAIREATSGIKVDVPVFLYNSQNFNRPALRRRLQGHPVGAKARALFMVSPLPDIHGIPG